MKKILYIDMDNVFVDFPSAFSKLNRTLLERYEHKDDIPGIFSLMKPMPGAIEAFEKLAKKFVENCGTNAGTRTLYRNMAYAFWEERGLSMENFEKVIAQIEASALEYNVIVLRQKLPLNNARRARIFDRREGQSDFSVSLRALREKPPSKRISATAIDWSRIDTDVSSFSTEFVFGTYIDRFSLFSYSERAFS